MCQYVYHATINNKDVYAVGVKQFVAFANHVLGVKALTVNQVYCYFNRPQVMGDSWVKGLQITRHPLRDKDKCAFCSYCTWPPSIHQLDNYSS